MASGNKHFLQDERFRTLKTLLLEEDQQKIEQLEAELEKLKAELSEKERLLERFDPIVGELLKKRMANSQQEMAEAIAPLLGMSIKKQVTEAREDIVDALYPAIGQMIRRSVAEYMKKIANDINNTVNAGFSPAVWLSWLKAKVFRMNPAEVIIAESVSADVEEIYLISKDSGLLIAHITGKENNVATNDAQIVGGMLTAIKSFAEDAFNQSNKDELREINYSDRTILIDPGRHSYLAAVYTSVAPANFGPKLQKCHEKIHKRYFRQLRDYNGNNSTMPGIETMIRPILKNAANPSNE